MTEEEKFNSYLEDERVKKLFKYHRYKFRNVLSSDEIVTSQLSVLWKTVQDNHPEEMFMICLSNRIKWEYVKVIKNIIKNKRVKQLGDIDKEDRRLSIDYFDEYLELIPKKYHEILTDRFKLNMTYKEIGEKNKYSTQRAEFIIKEALNILKDRLQNCV